MSSPDFEVRLNGTTWLRSVTSWGDLSFGFSWPGGCNQLSFTATTKYGTRIGSLLRAAPVELSWAGQTVWAGMIQEPEWNGSQVSVTAQGAFREAVQYAPLDGSNDPTDNALTAVTQAVARGLDWTISGTIPNTALNADSPFGNVAGVLDAHATRLGQRWYVGADRVVYMAADPTTPSYHVRAGAADMGIAPDDFASQVVLLYNDSGTLLVEAAIYPSFGSGGVYETTYGHAEWMKDITDQGPMSAATAAGIAQAVYEKAKQKPGFTNGLALGVGEILDANWQPVHPARVALEAWGRVVRAHGIPDMALSTPYTDFVVGSTGYGEGSPLVTVNPVGLAARDPESITVEILEALVKSGVLLGQAA